MTIVASVGLEGVPQALRALAHRLPSLALLLIWLALVILIAWSYIGKSTSPYGTCYARSGRAVPCAALEH